jgi:hypothetical protein
MEIMKPTIAEALERFLEEHSTATGPKKFSRYREVVELLETYLNSHGAKRLTDAHLRKGPRQPHGDDARPFCSSFGPDQILPNVEGFIQSYLGQELGAGRELLRAGESVTRKLAGWLELEGYVRVGAAESSGERHA